MQLFFGSHLWFHFILAFLEDASFFTSWLFWYRYYHAQNISSTILSYFTPIIMLRFNPFLPYIFKKELYLKHYKYLPCMQVYLHWWAHCIYTLHVYETIIQLCIITMYIPWILLRSWYVNWLLSSIKEIGILLSTNIHVL